MLKEIHLHLKVKRTDFERGYYMYDDYIGTKEMIQGALNSKHLDYIIHTTQPHFLSFKYLPARLFVHFYNKDDQEEIHEITLDRCEGTEKELREAHNLERMLLAGSFDWWKG
jgi:hypothetical protein